MITLIFLTTDSYIYPMNEKIFFAHANGFPSEVYGDLFEGLKDFDIGYIPMLAHGEHQIKNSWRDVAPEIIAYFDTNYSEPVWAIGHSFGAVSLAFAAEQRPDLFKGLIMMDPPVLSRKIRWILAITQCLGISQYIMPLAKMSAKRSDHFPSREFVAGKLRSKFLFKNFGQASFDNYIKYGFKDADEGIALRFKKEIETKIFALTPPFYKPVKLTIPNYYIYASRGEIAKTRNIDSIKHLFPNTEFIPFEGGHLFPLEQTEKCGKEIVSILQSQKN